MKKSLFILITLLLGTIGAKAELTADWRIHMPYDAWATTVIETPNRVYFMGRTFEYNANVSKRDVSSNSLFYYDKAGDEIVSINARTTASGNAVACIGYNYEKKYLLVVYTDCNIDFIYDNGQVYNLQALKVTSIPGKKEANSINFDPARNRAYVATSFGYICLNDQKHEIEESRNYGESIGSIAACGNNIVLSQEGQIYYAPITSHRFNFSDYTLLEGAPKTDVILPLKNGRFAGYQNTWDVHIDLFTPEGGSYTWRQLETDPKIHNVQAIKDGFALCGNVRLFLMNEYGIYKAFARPNSEWTKPATSLDGTELWCLEAQKGLKSYKVDGMALTRNSMRPNAPATYVSTSLLYHPNYGMLAGSNGVDLALNDFSQATPAQVSALKSGTWKEYGPQYTNPDRFSVTTNYFGLAIDPKNPNYLYRTNTTGGIMRLNLTNPNDMLIMANPSNPNSSKEGFIQIADNLSVWRSLCRFTTPQFTPDGTMWTLYNYNEEHPQLWYWPSADRLATMGASTYRPMKKLDIPGMPSGNSDVMITLTRNPNIVVIGGEISNYGSVIVYDHKGTPDVKSDDRYVYINKPYDQDGGSVSFLQVNALAEDPESGIVYIMTQRGLFTINPATIFDNPNTVNRIKVARNDGTNLADYLLNEINVNHMSIDGEGRKWFSTSNGLVCTSKDGRQILGEFTSDNSYLPEGNVYATAYNPENNSLMVATDGGLVEMFPSGSGQSVSSDDSGVRVYPNPVEPDYYGWVRIDNIADGSLVKITDSRGGIVKELGPAQGGSVEWDVSGLSNTRVSTGVYYIMVSPGGNNGGKTQISKVLVLN